MKNTPHSRSCSHALFTSLPAVLLLASCFAVRIHAQDQSPEDKGWPRVFEKDGKQLTVYQPQLDYWRGFTNLHVRCAISVKGVLKKETFGVAEMDADSLVDQANRLVAIVPYNRQLRFAGVSDADEASLRAVVDEIRPPNHAITLSLDRALSYLNPSEQSLQKPVQLNLDPPKIFYSRQPAILVQYLGNPRFKPTIPDRSDLLFAVNSNWEIFFDTASQRYFLLNQDNWLTAPGIQGPWSAAVGLPTALWSLPPGDNWDHVRTNLPGKKVSQVPQVFVSARPAELIITKGDPSYRTIKGTHLKQVSNTESIVIRNSDDETFYFLTAGRWFSASSLDGPWAAASKNMPAEFGKIPDTDPLASVKASVPGTQEAQDAVLLASVASTTTVPLTNPVVLVTYDGEPKFKTIEGSPVQYAVNTAFSVFQVNGRYYCCDQGVWFESAAATGPWSFCGSVPDAIYSIPPSCPQYHVTYVTVQSTNVDSIVYAQTSGYSGEYVSDTGVLMFGAGLATGAVLADQDEDYYYYYPPPVYYSYGCGAYYNYWYGGYYGSGYRWYGPYGGVGYATAYNPATGTYARGAAAYGPYGSARVAQAYNPYTGGYARAAQVSTAYGTATRVSGYNPATGNAVWGASRTSAYGSAAAVRTSQGTGVAAWNTANRQGAVAKTQNGNVYAAKDGTVYRKDSNGNWSQNSGNGWQNVNRPQPTGNRQAQSGGSVYVPPNAGNYGQAQNNWNQNRQNLEAQDRARARGNFQSGQARSFRGGGGRGGGRR
jgi:hypothetical protein